MSVPAPLSLESVYPACAGTAEALRTYLLGLAPSCRELHDGCRETLQVPQGLVDVRQVAPEVRVLPAPCWSHPELRFFVRPEVGERLRRVATGLPAGIELGLWEGLRPLPVQRRLWTDALAFLRARHPEASTTELEVLLESYVARPEGKRPPHSTGSAVDVAAVDAFGRVMAPGDAWGRLGYDAVARLLREAGLAHYDPEWWHWSYGDEEWALANDCAPLTFHSSPAFTGAGDGI